MRDGEHSYPSDGISAGEAGASTIPRDLERLRCAKRVATSVAATRLQPQILVTYNFTEITTNLRACGSHEAFEINFMEVWLK